MEGFILFWRDHKRESIFLILILGIAALLRFWALDRVPAGLYFDEAADAVDALNTLRTGHWPAFYDTQSGKEALWMWLLAAFFAVADVGPLQIRLVAAVVGLLTVGAVWWATRELFAADPETSAANLALLAAAILATLFVHVHFSRGGYRLITQPLVGSLAIGALWRGLHGKGGGWFILAGALLGLAMYTYSAARFYLVLLVVFFLLEWLLARNRSTAFLPRYFWFLAGMGLSMGLVFMPMALHMAHVPDLLLSRADEVSVFNPTWNQGRPWAALFDSTWRNFAGLVWYGSEDTHWNIPGRPMLDALTIPLFLAGIVVAGSRWRRPVYLFLLLWLVILYLPAILSYDRVPVFHRAQGAVPAVAMLVALGTWTIWQWLARRIELGRGSVNAFIPVAVILLVSGTLTAYDYFFRWGPSWYAYLATQPYYMELIQQMNSETEARAVYLFPYDLRNGRFEHPDLQLFYHGASPYVSISDHEGELLTQLTQAVAGREVVRVVDWKLGRSAEADPKRWIPHLLTMYGQSLGVTTETDAYRIESFRLSASNLDFRVMPPLQPVEMPVGEGLTLRAFAFGPTRQTPLRVGSPLYVGSYGWVLLTWSVAGPTSIDYKASVRLLNKETVIAQNDKILLNGFHLGTTQWHRGEENFDLYLLPLKQAGRYRLQVIVYDSSTLKELHPASLMLPKPVVVKPVGE